MTAGGRTSFRAFYERALPAVYGYLHQRLGGDVQRTMDLTQETFMAITQQWPLPADITNEVGWAVGIARHKVIDDFRREERRIGRMQRSVAMHDQEPHGATPAWEARLHAALARIPPMQRAALLLRYADDLPVSEVAAALGKSIRATESLLVRGRHNLERAFAAVVDV